VGTIIQNSLLAIFDIMGDELKKIRTDFLLPKKSFFVGMASAFNLFGNFFEYKTSKNGIEADKNAIANDVAMINQDFQEVVKRTKSNLHSVG
jgi:hypothetical protein